MDYDKLPITNPVTGLSCPCLFYCLWYKLSKNNGKGRPHQPLIQADASSDHKQAFQRVLRLDISRKSRYTETKTKEGPLCFAN